MARPMRINKKLGTIVSLCIIVIIIVICGLYINGMRYNKEGFQTEKPLKVAVLFSGRINGYEHLKDHLLNLQKTYNATFFASINKKRITPYVQSFFTTFSMNSDQYIITQTSIPQYIHNCIRGSHHYRDSTYPVLYQNSQVFKQLEKYQETHNVLFDTIVIYRADINPSEVLLLQKPSKYTLYIPEGKDFRGLNGHMAYGDFDTMKTYCSVVDSLEAYCEKNNIELNHEVMLNHHIKNTNLTVIRFKYNFELHPSRHDTRAEYTEGDT